jgi:predicted permease
MGLPFLKMLFGDQNSEILIYAAAVLAVFNFVMWTLGVYVMTGDKKQMSFKKIITNPTTVCILLGLTIFLTVKTPFAVLAQGTAVEGFVVKLMDSLNIVADLVTPLSMILIGVKLAGVKPSRLFTDKGAYVVCACKLVLMSLVTMLVVAFLPIDPIVKYTVVFMLGMPSAASTVLFAVRFGSDSDSASISVLLSTILSIVIIPLMCLIFQNVFGVPAVI